MGAPVSTSAQPSLVQSATPIFVPRSSTTTRDAASLDDPSGGSSWDLGGDLRKGGARARHFAGIERILWRRRGSIHAVQHWKPSAVRRRWRYHPLRWTENQT